MRRVRLGTILTVGVGVLAGGTVAAACPDRVIETSQRGETAIFYYPWYGTPTRDADWQHWGQNASTPPHRIASAYYPVGGPYSSIDPPVLRRHMTDIAGAGISTVIVSWWGPTSAEGQRLSAVALVAQEHGLRVALHVEPYGGRSPTAVADEIRRLAPLGITDFYVYDSTAHADADWKGALESLRGVRVFAHTALVGKAAAGGFDGVYTYDVLLHNGSGFRRLCRQARQAGLLCAPSVGPGFDAVRATGSLRTRDRDEGATYDRMWSSALRARPDVITVTSYNEWHEGTQIEPARIQQGYVSYDGAWGLRGRSAERAYLDRTAFWASQFAKG